MASNGDTEHQCTITKELLEPSVKIAGQTKSARIIDFTSKAGSKKGDNYASIINAVEVKASVGNGEVKTYHFIVKEMPGDPARRKILDDIGSYSKEVEVYDKLLPAMIDVQKQLGVKQPTVVSAPVMYSHLDQEQIIIFQDLSKLGYEMGDKYNGLDKAHCQLAMTELGKFHGLSYALKQQSDVSLEKKYPFLEEMMLGDKMEPMFGPFMENSYDMAIKTVEAMDAPLAQKMKAMAGRVYQLCKDIRYDTEGLELICHGDFWVNNMLFKYNKERVPVGIKLLDFQIVRLASPTLDLNYFFYTSTTADLRRNHLDDLLKVYHDTFTNTLKSVGIKFPELTFDRLKQKFNKDRLSGFFFACMALPLMMARPEESLNMDDLKLDMNDDQIVDEFKTRMEDNLVKMKDNFHFQDRLKGVAEDMVHVNLI